MPGTVLSMQNSYLVKKNYANPPEGDTKPPGGDNSMKFVYHQLNSYIVYIFVQLHWLLSSRNFYLLPELMSTPHNNSAFFFVHFLENEAFLRRVAMVPDGLLKLLTTASKASKKKDNPDWRSILHRAGQTGGPRGAIATPVFW